jgi:tellurite resistance protein TerC
VLFWGIVAAMVLRAIFVALGAAMVSRFDWLLYLFGLFLVVTGVRMVLTHDAKPDLRNNALVNWMTRRLRVTNDLERERFFLVRPSAETGKPAVHATRLFLAFMAINVADIIFAVDSVPAVLSMTQDPFIVYTSNIFAILGLRALYFVIDALIAKFRYLRPALSILLIFIGCVIFYERLVGDFNNVLTMLITFAVIIGAIVASVLRPGHA